MDVMDYEELWKECRADLDKMHRVIIDCYNHYCYEIKKRDKLSHRIIKMLKKNIIVEDNINERVMAYLITLNHPRVKKAIFGQMPEINLEKMAILLANTYKILEHKGATGFA